MGKRAYMKGRKTAVFLMMGLLAAASPSASVNAEEETSAQMIVTGTYQVPEGWSEDIAETSDTQNVYKQSEYLDQEDTSVITCSYLATNYSVQEYEQLRDMLTNDMVYDKVNAKISSTCTYTDSKDNLFILTADDASKDYRDIVCYVVGDQECFVVEVKEYRAEAESARADKKKTPEEAAKEIASKFSWQ